MVYPPESLARITPARLECAVFVLHERPTFLHRRACLTRRSWACALPRRSRACAAFTLALRSRATRLAFCSLPARSRALFPSRSALARRFLAASLRFLSARSLARRLSERSARLFLVSLPFSSRAFALARRSRFLAAFTLRSRLAALSLSSRARFAATLRRRSAAFLALRAATLRLRSDLRLLT